MLNHKAARGNTTTTRTTTTTEETQKKLKDHETTIHHIPCHCLVLLNKCYRNDIFQVCAGYPLQAPAEQNNN
jgi:hypothetical protein